jgi:Chlorophyll A-B binding protein.
MKSVLFLALAGSAAAAFAPSTQSRSNTLLKADLSSLPGSTAPVGPFDPLNLADSGSEETLAWFRASELKHGRVAMLATTGYLVQGAGIHFPGMLSSDVSFESLSAMKPLEAWDAVPDAGKAQILGTIFIAEMITESKPVHYTKGGPMPTMVFPAIDFSGVDAATLKRKQDSELNNGRLAMIAIMSFISAANIPGSVPALTNNPAF